MPSLLIALAAVAALAVLPATAAPARLFVATKGNDAWSGHSPDPAGQDGPFLTLARARDAVRAMKLAGGLPTGGVEVVVRGGVYELPETLVFGAADAGTAAAPIVYRSQPGEAVTLLGGRAVTNFKSYRDGILQADLRALGLEGVAFKQLVFDGRRMPWARYPNVDPDQPLVGGYAATDGQPVPMYTDIPGEGRRTFQYRVEDTRTWSNPAEGEVLVFARYNWMNSIVPIEAVDRTTRTITLARDASYPVRPTDRYYVQGLREELDAPGEWYLDREAAILYFIPPEPLNGRPVYVPVVKSMIEVGEGAAHLTLRGFALECCEGSAVSMRQATDCVVAGCTIRNVGDYSRAAVAVNGGARCGVVGCDIHHVGRDGINLTGGDRVTLTPGEHYAENNYLHHPGLDYMWGTGIYLTGCGLRATRNLIHDCPRAAIGFSGNLLVIEYNRLRHLCLNSEDAAGVGTGGRDWISSRGSVVRYNVITDVLGYGRHNGKWVSPFFAWGIYLDDNTGGVDVIGNVVARAGRAGIHLHNARDIVVRNNVFVGNGQKQLELSGWNTASGAWARHLPTMMEGYNKVKDQPVWQQMRGMDTVPENAPLLDGTIMAGNVFERNIAVSHAAESTIYRANRVNWEHNWFDFNLLWSTAGPPLIDAVGKLPAAEQWPAWQAVGEDPHSQVADPLFIDPEHDDYRLRPDSPALKLGFEPLPLDQVGPYASELRASWPIQEASGAREHPIRGE